MRKMKDSGIEWIGQIPNDWTLTKIKYLLTDESDSLKVGPFGSQLSGSDIIEDGFWVYSQRTVLDKNFEKNIMFVSKEKFLSMVSFQVREKDILITTRGTIGKIARVPNDFQQGIIHPCVMKFRLNEDIFDYNFLELIFNHSDILKDQLTFLSNATTIEVIYSGTLKNIILPYPSLPEQKKIADFLDAKCADIDQIRADIEKQIEILTDYKKSIITEAVTKGLDPKAKMKDSGIEWVGKIPEHWDVHPLYYYFGERKHKNVLGEEKNLLSISYGKIIRKNIDSKEGLLPENFNGYNIIEKDDIVMRLTDLQNDKRSLRTGLVKEHGIITSAYVTLKAKRDLNAVYFHYLLHCYDLLKVLYNMGNGVRQGLNYSELSRMLLIEPPLSEQKAIATYLDDKCSEIDATIAEKQKQLETLEEYKKSLIFEYVTGKKEVV